jgi:hypothetical protein
MHALRHTYASVLLEDGVSIKHLPNISGTPIRAHPSNLSHLMPSSKERARAAVDRAFATGIPLEEG